MWPSLAQQSLLSRALRASALLLAATAANHARLAAAGADDPRRHCLFALINVALGALLVARPRWALAPTALLSIQQAHSHGGDLVRSMRGPGPVDWTSALVLVFFAALLTLLVVGRRTGGRPEPPRAAPPGS